MLKKKLHFPTLFGFFTIVFLICNKVNLYGDDFHYAVYSTQDLEYFIQRNYQHYFLANGRVIVHLLVTFFLSIPIIYWKICNALMLTFSIFLMLKICKLQTNLIFSIVLSFFLFFTIGISITRQSVYWLTGSFNYVYPIFTLLVYWFLITKNSKFLPFFAIFASQTTEQGSMMAFGLMVLYFIKSYIKDKQIPSKIWIFSLIINLFGLLSIILSPGTFNRIDTTPNKLSFFDLLLSNIKHQNAVLFFDNAMLKTHIIILGFLVFYCAIKIINKQFIKTYLILLIPTSIVFLIYSLVYLNIINYQSMLFICSLNCVLYFAILLAVSGIEFLYYSNEIPIIALILGLGSQFMMIVSPVYGYRILLSFIFMMILFIVSLMRNLVFNPIVINVLSVVIFALCIVSAKSEYIGYKTNDIIYNQNMQALDEGKTTQTKLPLESYRWVMPYDNSYYKGYYNLTFDLPVNTDIVWN